MSERMEKERKEQREQTRAVCRQVFLQKRTLLLLLIPLGVLLLELAKGSASFTEEVFAKRIYKVISISISFLTGFLPFSLAEGIVLIAPLLLVLFLVLFVRRIVKARGGVGTVFRVFMSGILNVACAVSVFFFVYVIVGGVNY